MKSLVPYIFITCKGCIDYPMCFVCTVCKNKIIIDTINCHFYPTEKTLLKKQKQRKKLYPSL